jgi:uncharacterized protein (DUF302 family)
MDGLTTIRSDFSPKETMDRLIAELGKRGMLVFGRIDHAARAAEAGLALRPTELLLFGSQRAGTPLMQASQTVGIDLPLKCLVWQDAAEATWISYNEPAWIARRHQLSPEFDPSVSHIAEVLSAMTQTSAKHCDQTI